ncbi:hypothetical protein BKA70DRAFT_1074258, partial [Coprinopsis sp. MPI-PUGE-AT-0042]
GLLSLQDDCIYAHRSLCLANTSCNQEDGSVLRISGVNCNLMIANPAYEKDTVEHPYLYGKVEGLYHANVLYQTYAQQPRSPTHMEFVRVRWYKWEGRSMGLHGLELLSLPSVEDPGSFGFVDPRTVIRGCHIMPKF